MIKLIASDLDGTLLYGRDNTVSEEMFSLIREMNRRGIIFAAASGRQYHNMKKLFAPVWEEMAFICENGASVFYEDRLLAEKIAPREELLKLVEMIDADAHTRVALSSSTTTYVSPQDPHYVKMLEEFGNHVRVVENWEDVTEPCVKLAWFEEGGAYSRLAYWQEKVMPPAKVVTSGAQWLDILYPDSHKGVGIRVLQEYFGLKKEETAAFGDNDNDQEMLEAVGYPFAMKNGRKAILKMCPYHTDSVEKSIRQILDGDY